MKLEVFGECPQCGSELTVPIDVTKDFHGRDELEFDSMHCDDCGSRLYMHGGLELKFALEVDETTEDERA